VRKLSNEVEELADHKEVSAAALTSLEATLARMERAEVTGRGGRAATPPRARQQPHQQQQLLPGKAGPTGGGSSSVRSIRAGSPRSSRASEAGSGEEGGAAIIGSGSASGVLLSRELVQARLAIADLQRKLKVSAR
jgi:hypothetical protein